MKNLFQLYFCIPRINRYLLGNGIGKMLTDERGMKDVRQYQMLRMRHRRDVYLTFTYLETLYVNLFWIA